MTSVRVTKERSYSPHHTLLGAARVCLKLAEEKHPGSHYHEFTAIVMSSLSIEALANAVGSRIVTDWADFESSNPWAKLRLLCETLHIEFDRSKEPWSSAKWLCGFRNKVAHGKPQDILMTVDIPDSAYDNNYASYPDSALESQVTLGNAKRAFDAALAIKLAFFNGLPEDLQGGIYSDQTVFSASRDEG